MSYRQLFALVSTLGSSNTASLQCLCLRNSYKENIAAPSVWSREICFILDEMLALSTTLESKASGQGFPFPEKCTLTSSMTPKLQNRNSSMIKRTFGRLDGTCVKRYVIHGLPHAQCAHDAYAWDMDVMDHVV